ncbi:hypothetical protein J41TS12_10840 [Paenibacillus antibioticophila]|uniref:Uncharacterized protein n=1 Tax=Paenibacillus antibioticophila TaxID=1274374 RepID=A0A920CFX2_9BACL|nr:hypothetical protein [Paenibacillus antibioticophila]GIO36223.1 hypothetical protein J41TS12_10840 [Paenibacillus antibioticophila]
MKTVKLSDLRPGQYINHKGEVITKEKAEQIVEAGECPLLYTVSDEYIAAALDDLSRARKAGEAPKDFCEKDAHAMRVVYWHIYKVNDDYIAAVTREQATALHLDTIGTDWYAEGEEPDVEVIPADQQGRFEREDGRGYDEMTFGEWLADFEYTGPQLLCWNE